MSCPYYWWNHHYACRKSEKDVNEDIYYKYCRDYNYRDCPVYKRNDTSGCFLTSACVQAKNLTDDCHELTILRRFRDGYMRDKSTGPADICEYYNIAPMIVEKIQQLPNALEVFEKIYNELVLPCVSMIESGKNEEAYATYRDYTKMLQQQYMKGV